MSRLANEYVRKEPIAFDVNGAAQALSASPTSVRRLIASGKLQAKQFRPGGKWYVPADSIRRMLAEK